MKAPALLLALLALAACQRAAVQPFDPFGQAKVAPPKDARAPLDGVFRDQRGRFASLRALARGRPIVLAPVQYRCPSLCGLTLIGVDQAARRQPDRRFLLAALDIDPHEGPDAAAEATAALKTPISALTGPEKASRAVSDALGYRYAWDARTGQYAHIAAVAVLKPDGRLARWLPGPQVDPAALARALDEARYDPPAPLPQRLFLLCYHLASQAKAHDRLVAQALRIAAGATFLVLLLLVGWLAGREPWGRARR